MARQIVMLRDRGNEKTRKREKAFNYNVSPTYVPLSVLERRLYTFAVVFETLKMIINKNTPIDIHRFFYKI